MAPALNKHVEQHARATKRAEEERAKERESEEVKERGKEDEGAFSRVRGTFCGVSFRFVSNGSFLSSLLFKSTSSSSSNT